ncbi:DNA ligase [Marinomonas phage CPP1m]|uniref:DNA ligase n=2 Tax=Murciavirus CPP1m TaxID=2733327 RepID=A0A1W5S0Z6_9CAUD|nr:DNA ligase [Marinomonas phage CPP1m]ARB11246.1 DNA ligase [Marinomonas phage CPP1m]ARB11296.1 DNA ligase [Marinomonas phage CPG1g]
MNIFEYLGLPPDHRKGNKVVQLVKHWDEVNKKDMHKKATFPMLAQCKKDGNFAAVVVEDNEAAIFNRLGSRFTNLSDLEWILSKQYLPDGVYFAELCNSQCSLEELSGMVSPVRVKPLSSEQVKTLSHVNLFFFDLVSIEEFKEGSTPTCFCDRYEKMVSLLYSRDLNWLDASVVTSIEEVEEFADKMIANGQEGAVFKPNVGWLAGAKDWHQMKKVKQISYDLECIGIEEGTGKYEGKVANLLFRFKEGREVKAMLGKGWTHDAAEDLFNHVVDDVLGKDSPVGKVFKVYALQESSKGLLRLPKAGERRDDKCNADF